jgi:leucyl aminopeptidase
MLRACIRFLGKKMKINFEKMTDISQLSASTTVIFLSEETIGSLRKSSGVSKNNFVNSIKKSVVECDFNGKKNETITAIINGRVILYGLGKEENFEDCAMERIGYEVFETLKSAKTKNVTCIFSPKFDENGFALDKKEELQLSLIFGIQVATYSFDKYLTGEKLENKKYRLENVTFLTNSVTKLQKIFDEKNIIIENMFFCRDLINEPANIIYPESFAKICKGLEKLGVEVEVLGVKDMEKLGMGSLLAVGQGSDRESKMVILNYKGTNKKTKPIAIVGKGVTFDSGGLSLKPANAMETMKCDMSGAATVASVVRLLATRKAKVNVVGVMPLVENMPSGKAIKEGDIVKSMSGQTIEIMNTDAEGRMILADALYYTATKFKPQLIIDLATLTGAICVALGERYAGLFTNNDDLAKELRDAGKKVSENVWRMPMSKIGGFYDEQIDSDIADMKNCGKREGGSITAAQFLQRFIDKHPKWAHLDIAATAFVENKGFLTKKYATGYGVRLLNELIKGNYE